MTALDTLTKYWNHTSFRGVQEKIIKSVLDHKNTLAVLPTGGGKSVCYQIPALMNPGICIVISPLLSLMYDQVNNLNERGIKAIAVTGSMSEEELIIAFDNLRYGNYKFLYLSPEKLQSALMQQKIKQLQVNLIAIDEVHCISEWGHDFRPAYLKIPLIKELHPKTPIIGLTATATAKVRQDIIENLQFSQYELIEAPLKRKNLSFKTLSQEMSYETLQKILPKGNLPTIIYVSTRRKVKDTCRYLNKNGFLSAPYHGGMTREEKMLSFQDWMQEKTPIMVATNAFGMGIDKDNVNTIIHLDLPQSLENYMQEAGRAGRNNEPASSYIVADQTSQEQLKHQVSKGLLTINFVKKVYAHLNQTFQIDYGSISEEYYEFDLPHFVAQYELPLVETYSALKLLERMEILSLDENTYKRSTLRFSAPPKQVLQVSKKSHTDLIKILLRSHGGIFEQTIAINEAQLSKKLKLSIVDIKNQLEQLHNDGLVIYNKQHTNAQLRFLVPREDDYTIHSIAPTIKRLNAHKLEKMNAVLAYAKNSIVCRSRFLLSYFDEKSEACGLCDICIKKKGLVNPIDYEQVSYQILDLFSKQSVWALKDIIKEFEIEEKALLKALELLLDTDKLNITSQNKLERATND